MHCTYSTKMISCWELSLPLVHPSSTFPIRCTVTKQSERFLSTLSLSAGDSSVAHKLIGKFVATSPKSAALNALSHLLSPNTPHPHLTSLALPLYSKIREASWFKWNAKLVAELVAMLDKQGQYSDSEILISESVSKLGHRERELVNFYCYLVESHSKQTSNHGFEIFYAYLHHYFHHSSSIYVKRRAFESMVGGLCAMDRPREAESLVQEVRNKKGLKLKPSLFEFRSITYSYGSLGLLKGMLRVVERMEIEGFVIDTICSNMVLSSYGSHSELAQMILWLKKMKTLCIPFSIRTYNSVLNSCPSFMEMLQQCNGVPLSVEELCRILKGDEVLLVKELIGFGVLEEVMVCDSVEVKLDLHGMHLGTAYLMVLEWIDEMRRRFNDPEYVIPAEVTVVCGSGKHSNIRGLSPVKGLVKEMLDRMSSPMRIDRKNIGCVVAKGRAVKDWLCNPEVAFH